MNNLVLAIIFLLLALAGVVVRKTYYYLPLLEMKRRAERHDKLATSLYKAVAYGNSLSVLLWLYIGITSAAGLVLLGRQLNLWLSLAVISILLWLAFSLIPATRITRTGVWLTKLVTPSIAWILNYLYPLLNHGAKVVETRYISGAHSKLFERADFMELLERQKFQEDNRMSGEELEIVRRALSFDEFKVRDVLTPRKSVKTILASDTIGPILIDELHKTGQDYVLVREKAKGQVIGTLAFSRLGIDSRGKVGDVMDRTVYYLHENDSLSEALHAFFVTNHAMFIVVDSSEDFVGIISVEEIIRHLMGHLPGDDFDQYADPAAVAARYPKPPEKAVNTPELDETPVKTEKEMVE
jgi:CBS domain containing-hemolysin-like protein